MELDEEYKNLMDRYARYGVTEHIQEFLRKHPEYINQCASDLMMVQLYMLLSGYDKVVIRVWC